MTILPDVVVSPRLKVERAYRHIDELIRLTSPLADDLHTLRVETDVRARPTDEADPFALVYRPTKPIPETLALIIGDAAHNLRTSLDHLVSGVVGTCIRERFPFHPERKNFVTAPVLDSIEKALPGAKRLILDDIRPENGPNETLWLFNRLDNDDKHNLLIPTVTLVTVQIPLIVTGNVYRNISIGGDASRPQFLFAARAPFAIDNNFKPAVDVSFGPMSSFENEPVIPTLTQIAQIVTEAINAFEKLIVGNP